LKVQGITVLVTVAVIVAIVAGSVGYIVKPTVAGTTATVTTTAPGATETVTTTAPGATETVTTTAPGATETVTTTAPKPGEGLYFTYVSDSDPADPFQAKIVKGWEAAASMLGVNSVVNHSYADYAYQKDLVDAAIAAGVDGIFIFDVTPDEMHPSIANAVEAGIKVVTMSSRDPGYTPDVVPLVGYGMYDQGYVVGQYLAKTLENGANIVFFCEVFAPYSQGRRGGILGALDDAGITYNELDWFEVGVEYAVVKDTVKAYILAHPELNAVIGLGSLTTPAGGMSLIELGYEPGDIAWAGFDLGDDTVTAIKAGYGAANVDEVFMFGFYGCLTLYLKCEYDLQKGDVTLATAMVDSTNIADFEYWVALGIK